MDSTKYSIFISSTKEDLDAQRDAIIKETISMGNFPVGMELFNAGDIDQWETIKNTIEECDYFIVIVAHRYGSLTKEEISYTEKEYDYAISLGVPVLPFIIKDNANWPTNKIQALYTDKLNNFKSKLRRKMISEWIDTNDLLLNYMRSINRAIKVTPRPGYVPSSNVSSSISQELARLSKENKFLRSIINSVSKEAKDEEVLYLSEASDETFQYDYYSPHSISNNARYKSDNLMIDTLYQAEELLKRGLIADKTVLKRVLDVVGYYRLSEYWYPFLCRDKVSKPDYVAQFLPETTLQSIWNRYIFDRNLRLWVIDALDRVEVAIKTFIARIHGDNYGPNGYAYPSHSLPNMKDKNRNRFLSDMRRDIVRSRNIHVLNYSANNEWPPIWISIDIMSLGTVLHFYSGLNNELKRQIATEFGIHHVVFESWLTSLLTVRNICAHHARLWNRVIGTTPKIPKKWIDWHIPIETTTNRIFSILTILKYLMNRVAPQSQWPSRFRSLLNRFPEIPLQSMGFPDNWEQCPIWDSKQSAV